MKFLNTFQHLLGFKDLGNKRLISLVPPLEKIGLHRMIRGAARYPLIEGIRNTHADICWVH